MVPMSCLPVVLQLAEGDAVKVDSIMWSTYGVVVTLSCSHGTFFAEGGKSRTLVCINGVWPNVTPQCTGRKQKFIRGTGLVLVLIVFFSFQFGPV